MSGCQERRWLNIWVRVRASKGASCRLLSGRPQPDRSGAFPVAAVFMKKGVKFSNILIFIGAWSTTKLPMFLFELASLGSKFAVTRLLIDIPGIIVIALILSKLISKKETDDIYKNAEKL